MSQTEKDWFYKLFIDEAKGALSRGGDVTIISSGSILTDKTTNKEYELYVDDGKLSMEERGG